MVWTEHFAYALLGRAGGDGQGRPILAVLAMLGGVQASDPASLRPARAWSARSC